MSAIQISYPVFVCKLVGGRGNALTMTMTPWNLTLGQWSQKLTMATVILESAQWSMVKMVILWLNFVVKSKIYQSQNAKRASSQKRHMVISIFLLCNSLILMSIGAGSIRAIKGGLDKVFKIRDRLHRICRQILR